MSSQRRRLDLLLLVLASTAFAADDEIAARVAYVTPDGLYVDAGAERGLLAGDIGIVRRDGKEIARVEVVAVSRTSARVRVHSFSEDPTAGDAVYFRRRAVAEKPEPEVKRPQEQEPFVPLLERQRKRPEASRSTNIFHGRINWRQYLHLDGNGDLDYWTTVVGVHGSLDRVSGTPWRLDWSGNLSARGGSAFDMSSLEGARLDLYELSLRRPMEDGGFIRIGRFLPREISNAGFLDGAQIERVVSETLRLGGIVGLKPTRDDLAPSFDEPTAVAYATFAQGGYSGTFGLLGGWFDGSLDRTALLFDQHYETESRFRIDASGEIDFDVGAAMVRSGTRLTRFDVYASLPVSGRVTLRAGADHHERLDNRAERAGLGSIDPAFFDAGFWRHFAGASFEPIEKLHVDAEVAVIDSEPVWRLGVTRRDIFSLPGASVSLTLYSLSGMDEDGFGGLASAYLPFRNGRWTLSPSLGFRSLGSLDVTDVRLRAEYRASQRTSLFAGLAHSLGDSADSTLLEFGFTYRW